MDDTTHDRLDDVSAFDTFACHLTSAVCQCPLLKAVCGSWILMNNVDVLQWLTNFYLKMVE